MPRLIKRDSPRNPHLAAPKRETAYALFFGSLRTYREPADAAGGLRHTRPRIEKRPRSWASRSARVRARAGRDSDEARMRASWARSS